MRCFSSILFVLFLLVPLAGEAAQEKAQLKAEIGRGPSDAQIQITVKKNKRLWRRYVMSYRHSSILTHSFSNDGKYLAVSGVQGGIGAPYICVFDLKRNKKVLDMDGVKHKWGIHLISAVAVDSTRQKLIVARDIISHQSIEIWDMKTQKFEAGRRGEMQPVTNIDLLANELRLKLYDGSVVNVPYPFVAKP